MLCIFSLKLFPLMFLSWNTSARVWRAMQPHSSVCINCYFQHWLMHKTLITVCPDSRLMHCRFSIVQPTVQKPNTAHRRPWVTKASCKCLAFLPEKWLNWNNYQNNWIRGNGKAARAKKKISPSSKPCCVTFQLVMLLVWLLWFEFRFAWI